MKGSRENTAGEIVGEKKEHKPWGKAENTEAARRNSDAEFDAPSKD